MTKTTLSRRNFVRMSAAGAMLFGITGCAPSGSDSKGFKPGTYTASAEDKHGPITIQAAFDEAGIVDIQVTEHSETRYISDMALEEMPRRIVELQSVDIDTITGATLSSMAILNAAKDCVKQAGGKPGDLASGAPESHEGEVVEMDVDLVVVGAGASGMAAAVAAAQSGAKSVAVVEKVSNMGGNALVSGGFIHYLYPPEELREPMNDGYAARFDTMLQRGAEAGVDAGFLDTLRKEYDDFYANGATGVFDSMNLFSLDYHLTNGGALENWLEYAPHVVEMDE